MEEGQLKPINEYHSRCLKAFLEPYKNKLNLKEPCAPAVEYNMIGREMPTDDQLLWMYKNTLISLDQLVENNLTIDFVDRNWDTILKINTYLQYRDPDISCDPVYNIHFNLKHIRLIINHWDWFMDLHATNTTAFIKVWNDLWGWWIYPDKNYKFINNTTIQAVISIVDKHIDWFIEHGLLHCNKLSQYDFFIKILERHWDKIMTTMPYENRVKILQQLVNHTTTDTYNFINSHLMVNEMRTIFIWNGICCSSTYCSVCLLADHWDYCVANNLITWTSFCRNSAMISLIDQHLNWMIVNNKIIWVEICRNYAAIHIINKYWDTIFVNTLSAVEVNNCLCVLGGYNKCSIHLIIRHWDFFCREDVLPKWSLYTDSNMADYEKYLTVHFIDDHWDFLVANNKVIARTLSYGPKMMPLLIKRWDWVLKEEQSKSPMNTFWRIVRSNMDSYYDEYEVACRAYFRRSVAEELMSVVWHPRNISRFAALGYATDA